MDPAAALRKAVHYLDRDLAPRQKLKAFTGAIEVVEKVGPAKIASLATTGSLTDLDGIGPSTSRVITEALADVDDGYLAELDKRTAIDHGVGDPILTKLRGECHAHTTWSDGGAPAEAMVATAIDLGHEWMVITDHSARLTVAHGLDEVRLGRQLVELAKLRDRVAPFRILTGMEVDILVDGSLDLSEELLGELDIVVGSVHSKLRMPSAEMTRRMVTAIASPHVDILGHCTNRKVVGTGRAPSEFDADIVFAACARFDTAVEINCRPERQDPPEDLLMLALEWECKIAINTDAHATGQLEWQPFGADKAVRCGVRVDDIINTWPAERLLDWARSHAEA